MDVTIPAYRRLKTDAIISRLTHLLGNGHREGFDTIHLDIAHEVKPQTKISSHAYWPNVTLAFGFAKVATTIDSSHVKID